MTKIYQFNKVSNTFMIQQQSISIINSFFNSVNLFSKLAPTSLVFHKLNVLLGKPVFSITADKVIINIFYFVNKEMSKNKINKNTLRGKSVVNSKVNTPVININNVNALGNALVRCWGRIVEIRLIRLNHVVLDSSILAQNLSYNTTKFNFNRIIKLLKNKLIFKTNSLNNKFNSLSILNDNTLVNGNNQENLNNLNLQGSSYLTGIKIQLSGRLTTQRSAPRQTKQGNRLGSSAKGIYSMTDYSQFTSKNKLGAFTIKVWISQQNS